MVHSGMVSPVRETGFMWWWSAAIIVPGRSDRHRTGGPRGAAQQHPTAVQTRKQQRQTRYSQQRQNADNEDHQRAEVGDPAPGEHMAVVFNPFALMSGGWFWRVEVVVFLLVIEREVCAPLLGVGRERVLCVARVRCGAERERGRNVRRRLKTVGGLGRCRASRTRPIMTDYLKKR